MYFQKKRGEGGVVKLETAQLHSSQQNRMLVLCQVLTKSGKQCLCTIGTVHMPYAASSDSTRGMHACMLACLLACRHVQRKHTYSSGGIVYILPQSRQEDIHRYRYVCNFHISVNELTWLAGMALLSFCGHRWRRQDRSVSPSVLSVCPSWWSR
jgi:hypothetical protein